METQKLSEISEKTLMNMRIGGPISNNINTSENITSIEKKPIARGSSKNTKKLPVLRKYTFGNFDHNK